MKQIGKMILTGTIAAAFLIGGARVLHNTPANAVTAGVTADALEVGDTPDAAAAEVTADSPEFWDTPDAAGGVTTDALEVGDTPDAAAGVTADSPEAGDTPDNSNKSFFTNI
jgi:hypothetical protein